MTIRMWSRSHCGSGGLNSGLGSCLGAQFGRQNLSRSKLDFGRSECNEFREIILWMKNQSYKKILKNVNVLLHFLKKLNFQNERLEVNTFWLSIPAVYHRTLSHRTVRRLGSKRRSAERRSDYLWTASSKPSDFEAPKFGITADLWVGFFRQRCGSHLVCVLL